MNTDNDRIYESLLTDTIFVSLIIVPCILMIFKMSHYITVVKTQKTLRKKSKRALKTSGNILSNQY